MYKSIYLSVLILGLTTLPVSGGSADSAKHDSMMTETGHVAFAWIRMNVHGMT